MMLDLIGAGSPFAAAMMSVPNSESLHGEGGGSATHKIISWAVCAFSPFVLFFFQSRWEVWSDVNQHAAECWMRR